VEQAIPFQLFPFADLVFHILSCFGSRPYPLLPEPVFKAWSRIFERRLVQILSWLSFPPFGFSLSGSLLFSHGCFAGFFCKFSPLRCGSSRSFYGACFFCYLLASSLRLVCGRPGGSFSLFCFPTGGVPLFSCMKRYTFFRLQLPFSFLYSLPFVLTFFFPDLSGIILKILRLR